MFTEDFLFVELCLGLTCLSPKLGEGRGLAMETPLTLLWVQCPDNVSPICVGTAGHHGTVLKLFELFGAMTDRHSSLVLHPENGGNLVVFFFSVEMYK